MRVLAKVDNAFFKEQADLIWECVDWCKCQGNFKYDGLDAIIDFLDLVQNALDKNGHVYMVDSADHREWLLEV